MRKLDYLRKLAKRTKYESDIYKWNVEKFRNKGDYGTPGVMPMFDTTGNLCGVAIDHSYLDDDGNVSTYNEYFRFNFPDKIIHPVYGFTIISRPSKRLLTNIAGWSEERIRKELTWEVACALS